MYILDYDIYEMGLLNLKPLNLSMRTNTCMLVVTVDPLSYIKASP